MREKTGRQATKTPQISELLSSLHFNIDQGLIWLNDQRMMLLHPESLGGLRHELIESLGLVRARGLFSRMGYASGARDAEATLKLPRSGGNSLLDVLQTGGQLHALEGVTSVEIVSGELDIERGRLYAEFIWKNSVEAKLALSAAGIRPHTACWLLEGYSSGFLSTCMGKRILVREITCCAKGDAECRAIAKPLKEWAPEEAADVRYYDLTSPVEVGQPLAVRDRIDPSDKAHDTRHVIALPSEMESSVIGASSAFNVVLHKLKRVASTRTTVLFLGDSGVGKSSMARELHLLSPRKDKPFVEMNCAAVPEQLMEAELFGVERGAYTGANEKRGGRFEQAHGGTFFLDEIGTLSFTAQGKLLRVIQTGEFEPLGTTQTKRVDVRIISATNANLQKAVEEGKFREDLFFRLNVFPIWIPSLRDRRDDIPLLLDRMLQRFRNGNGEPIPGITSRALRALLSYDWPGNIREMENVIERAVILADPGEPLDLRHLFTFDAPIHGEYGFGLNILGSSSKEKSSEEGSYYIGKEHSELDDWALELLKRGHSGAFDAVGDALVRAAMKEAEGNISLAARMLGLNRNQVEYRAKKKGLI